MITTVGPCRGPRFTTRMTATFVAMDRFSTTGTHQCRRGHWHPDVPGRPPLFFRIARRLGRGHR